MSKKSEDIEAVEIDENVLELIPEIDETLDSGDTLMLSPNEMKLKKLKKPITVGGFFLFVLFFIILTFALNTAFLVYVYKDSFTFSTAYNDMATQLGFIDIVNAIKDFFISIGDFFKNLF